MVDQLYLVGFAQRSDGFYLNDDSILNPQVSVIIAHNLAFIVDLDRFLLLDLQALFGQFDPQRVFIHFFQETVPQSIMHSERTSDDRLSQFSVFHFHFQGFGQDLQD